MVLTLVDDSGYLLWHSKRFQSPLTACECHPGVPDAPTSPPQPADGRRDRRRGEPAPTLARPAAAAPAAPPRRRSAAAAAGAPTPRCPLRWLEGGAPAALVGTTWGVPWPRGVLARGQELSLTTGRRARRCRCSRGRSGSGRTARSSGPRTPSAPRSPPAEEYVLRPGDSGRSGHPAAGHRGPQGDRGGHRRHPLPDRPARTRAGAVDRPRRSHHRGQRHAGLPAPGRAGRRGDAARCGRSGSPPRSRR